MMEEMVVGHGTSFLVAGEILQEKACSECPDGEPASGKMENLGEIGTGHSRKISRRKKRKLSAQPIKSLRSIEEGASLSVLVVQDGSVRNMSSNHLDVAPAPSSSGKMMEEVVAGHDTSFLAAAQISQEKASGECPGSEPVSGKMENLVEITTVHRRKKSRRRKKGKLSACPIISTGSIEEGASLSVLVVQDGSVRDLSLNHLDVAPAPSSSGKMMEEVVAGRGTSFLGAAQISQEKASGECPDGEPASGKMENLDKINTGHSRRKSRRRKKRKLSACPIRSLGSIEESTSSSVLVLQDSSVREISSYGTSRENISVECLDAEPEAGKQKKKCKRENLEEVNAGNSNVKDASRVDLPEKDFEHGDPDKPDVIQNARLDVYSAEVNSHNSTSSCKEDKASDDASGRDPSVNNLESDNFDLEPTLKDAVRSSSQLGAMTDDVSIAVVGKEGPQQSSQLSQGGSPPGNLRKKLLVLDVNGLLADIVSCVSGGYEPHTVISQKAVFKRPFCDEFLQFCFERFHVGIWSSRNKRNVKSALDFLMGKSKDNLLFCWDQSHCTVTGFNTVENREKPLLLKELKKLWEKHEPDLPWEKGYYNESNTLLLDDSPYKALRNPPHTAIFPHSYRYKDRKDNSLGPGGALRVYLEGLALADNIQEYVEMNPFGQRPITKTNLSWNFYLKVIGTPSSQREEDANDSSACQQTS